MKIRLVVTGFALVLAGCAAGTSDTSDQRAGTPEAAAQPASTLSPTGAPVAKRSAATFASLPDRGDLLGYLPTPAREVGRSSWHRVEVSEAHALRAAVSGSLRMTSPDGQVLDFRHTRHVEYPDGNWSWVGALPDVPGSQAIITFGERAVFGTFRRPGARPLELTMRDGVAWMVERDPAAMRGVDASSDPDFLVAPSAVGRAASATGRAASGQALRTTSAATTGTSGPVVDLVLGYTSGYASFHGGQSQANTRLTHLVTVTNDAYTRSRLNAQVRLVRTVQVTYPDNTDNNAALTDLTGSNGESTTTIPASLMPLRQARDQYGGDLVSLVRKFNDPENAGCGLAWLIGGGGSSYTTSDAPWGYSIVSDGSDGQYFCREETLAHELGHNMGQNHNSEDSEDSDGNPMTGVHPYSYGYRESSSTGFYTIMAYRSGDSQYSIPYFANPSVSVDGRPTGVANASDNVRSMATVLPVTAAFRATVMAGRSTNDFNGDGKSDVLWRNTVDGRAQIWLSADSAGAEILPVANTSWTVSATADFNGDGSADILWRNLRDERALLWYSASASAQQALPSVGWSWSVAGTGDFDADGSSDLLWRNRVDGRNLIWWRGNPGSQQALSSAGTSWNVAGVGDFDADGYSDILWRNVGDGRNLIWRRGSTATQQALTTVGDAWEVVGIGDFDADGFSDILWRNRSDGRNQYWRRANSATQQAVTTVQGAWNVEAVGDYDGDGYTDVFWRNSADGRNTVWLRANSSMQQTKVTVGPGAWQVQP